MCSIFSSKFNPVTHVYRNIMLASNWKIRVAAICGAV